jgi:hypothetical protein
MLRVKLSNPADKPAASGVSDSIEIGLRQSSIEPVQLERELEAEGSVEMAPLSGRQGLPSLKALRLDWLPRTDLAPELR